MFQAAQGQTIVKVFVVATRPQLPTLWAARDKNMLAERKNTQSFRLGIFFGGVVDFLRLRESCRHAAGPFKYPNSEYYQGVSPSWQSSPSASACCSFCLASPVTSLQEALIPRP